MPPILMLYNSETPCYTGEVTPIDKETPRESDRQYARAREQDFCRRALETDAYDTMSDRAWIAACEQAAASARSGRIDSSGGGVSE